MSGIGGGGGGTTSSSSTAFKSPVGKAFSQIQWDALGSLKLTAQETALLRMAETNSMEYTLADSRDASMYARVLLKLLSEASAAGAGSGDVSRLSPDEILSEEDSVRALSNDPLGVVSHYALTKLLEILDTLKVGVKGVTTATVFYVGKEGILVDQWKALLRVLNKGGKGDVFAQKVASLCLTKILVTACPSQRHHQVAGPASDKDGNIVASKPRPIQYASAMDPLEAITAWIVSQLKNASGTLVAICTPAMRVLMEAPETRALFCKSGGVKYMSRQLRVGSKSKTVTGPEKKKFGQASVQQLYEISFCMWILTYDLNDSYSIRQDFAKDTAAVSALVDLVSVAPREKVVRVALSSLRNLATCTGRDDPNPAGQTAIEGHYFLSEMIACGLMKAIDHLRERQFTDPDLVDDVECLHKLLHENYKEMSRWEVYKNEVESGQLQWGSTHTEAFFKENARMMEGSDGDFHLLKVLIALLSSKDEEVAAIACYDIGEFVRHYPNGRAIAKRLGAKELVMPLIEHENPELQRHALQCVSKIMVHNWEYVK
jgi:V-type H+-transporting ATPase subunit H